MVQPNFQNLVEIASRRDDREISGPTKVLERKVQVPKLSALAMRSCIANEYSMIIIGMEIDRIVVVFIYSMKPTVSISISSFLILGRHCMAMQNNDRFHRIRMSNCPVRDARHYRSSVR